MNNIMHNSLPHDGYKEKRDLISDQNAEEQPPKVMAEMVDPKRKPYVPIEDRQKKAASDIALPDSKQLLPPPVKQTPESQNDEEQLPKVMVNKVMAKTVDPENRPYKPVWERQNDVLEDPKLPSPPAVVQTPDAAAVAPPKAPEPTLSQSAGQRYDASVYCLRETVAFPANGSMPRKSLAQANYTGNYAPGAAQLPKSPRPVNVAPPDDSAFYSIMRGNGFGFDRSGTTYRGTFPIMNCSVRINRTVMSDSGSDYGCTIIMDGDVIQRDVKVEKFLEGRWLYEVPGFVLMGKKTDLTRYLGLVVQIDSRKNKTILKEKPGWHQINGTHIYVTPQWSITGTVTAAVTAEKGQDFINCADAQNATLSAFLEMADLTPGSYVASVLLLHTVISHLWSLFKEAGWLPKMVTFVLGATGCQKTSLSLAVTQLDGARNPKYPLSSTRAALESAYAEYRDAVVCFDDYKPGTSRADRSQQDRNVETVIRAFGDSNGRKRNRDYQLGLGQYEAEGGAVITGELLPCHGSSLARVLVLPLGYGGVDKRLLTSVQSRPRLAPFMGAFLAYVALNYSSVVRFINAQCETYKQMLMNKPYAHDRYREDNVILLTAIDLLEQYGSDSKQINSELKAALDRLRECVGKVLMYNMDLYTLDSPRTTICRAILEGIESNSPKVVPVGTPVGKGESTVFEDAECYFVRPRIILRWYETYIRQNGLDPVRYTTTEIGRVLADCGVLLPVKEGAQQRNAGKYRGCGTGRYMCLWKKVLKHVANSGEGNY